ncbi:hypothetical protein K438DRAFT_2000112 [Mycena galopus ATCC 62051]|nr:hypothetical protein K438DRAFT_2000112 [Mycena galopus ATCC 62051]
MAEVVSCDDRTTVLVDTIACVSSFVTCSFALDLIICASSLLTLWRSTLSSYTIIFNPLLEYDAGQRWRKAVKCHAGDNGGEDHAIDARTPSALTSAHSVSATRHASLCRRRWHPPAHELRPTTERFRDLQQGRTGCKAVSSPIDSLSCLLDAGAVELELLAAASPSISSARTFFEQHCTLRVRLPLLFVSHPPRVVRAVDRVIQERDVSTPTVPSRTRPALSAFLRGASTCWETRVSAYAAGALRAPDNTTAAFHSGTCGHSHCSDGASAAVLPRPSLSSGPAALLVRYTIRPRFSTRLRDGGQVLRFGFGRVPLPPTHVIDLRMPYLRSRVAELERWDEAGRRPGVVVRARLTPLLLTAYRRRGKTGLQRSRTGNAITETVAGTVRINGVARARVDAQAEDSRDSAKPRDSSAHKGEGMAIVCVADVHSCSVLHPRPRPHRCTELAAPGDEATLALRRVPAHLVLCASRINAIDTRRRHSRTEFLPPAPTVEPIPALFVRAGHTTVSAGRRASRVPFSLRVCTTTHDSAIDVFSHEDLPPCSHPAPHSCIPCISPPRLLCVLYRPRDVTVSSL